MQDNYKETRAKSKKFVRYAEGAELYSMTVLVNLEIFDEYMEQFREEPREMKNPLWKPENDNWKRK